MQTIKNLILMAYPLEEQAMDAIKNMLTLTGGRIKVNGSFFKTNIYIENFEECYSSTYEDLKNYLVTNKISFDLFANMDGDQSKVYEIFNGITKLGFRKEYTTKERQEIEEFCSQVQKSTPSGVTLNEISLLVYPSETKALESIEKVSSLIRSWIVINGYSDFRMDLCIDIFGAHYPFCYKELRNYFIRNSISFDLCTNIINCECRAYESFDAVVEKGFVRELTDKEKYKISKHLSDKKLNEILSSDEFKNL